MRLIGGIHHGTKRLVKELTLDKADYLYRLVTGQSYLPPYTLREFVGGAKGFKKVGSWFLNEFERLGLLNQGCHIFDIGCGCGRLAYTFATDPEMARRGVKYTGMDVDRKSVEWCAANISKRNPGFTFYHVDMKSVVYNPKGRHEAKNYNFPHPPESFDLIVLTSVFSHLLEDEVRQYLRELARVLKPSGVVYASFYTYKEKAEAVGPVPRRKAIFPFYHGHYALESELYPENAVAFQEDHLREMIRSSGLTLRNDPMYGIQDVFLLSR